MKLNVLIVPAMIGMALATASPASARHERHRPAACSTATAALLDAQFAAFNNAWATRDPDRVTALFNEDAVLLATLANVPRTDHAGIRDYFVSFLRKSPVGRIDTSTVKSGCNWALRAGTWTVSLTDPDTGLKSEVKARYTFLYQFSGGQWKIEHLHSSVMPELVAAPAH